MAATAKKARAQRPAIPYKMEIDWSPEDQAYVVHFPELPGCITHGESEEEALRMAKEAMELYLESLRERGLEVPEPLYSKKFSGKIPLRIDPVLHRDLAVRAAHSRLSLNKFIERKLSE